MSEGAFLQTRSHQYAQWAAAELQPLSGSGPSAPPYGAALPHLFVGHHHPQQQRTSWPRAPTKSAAPLGALEQLHLLHSHAGGQPTIHQQAGWPGSTSHADVFASSTAGYHWPRPSPDASEECNNGALIVLGGKSLHGPTRATPSLVLYEVSLGMVPFFHLAAHAPHACNPCDAHRHGTCLHGSMDCFASSSTHLSGALHLFVHGAFCINWMLERCIAHAASF